jgi:hypothetical protein
MTYGWAILIIAVVLSTLFALGIFNGSSLTPKAAPGSCEVYRGNGPGTTTYLSLGGLCNELPKFVGRFGYQGKFSNSGLSNITVKSVSFMPTITSSNKQQTTIVAWVDTQVPGPVETIFYYGVLPSDLSGSYNGIYMNYNTSGYCNGGLFVVLYQTITCVYQATLPIQKWMMVAMEYDGQNAIGYAIINGNVIAGSGAATPATMPAGGGLLIATPWNGSIADVQQYSTALSAGALKSLYLEGLGGAPIDLPDLVGWWPLNGNINDYSGNNQMGAPMNSVYSGVWTSDYHYT